VRAYEVSAAVQWLVGCLRGLRRRSSRGQELTALVASEEAYIIRRLCSCSYLLSAVAAHGEAVAHLLLREMRGQRTENPTTLRRGGAGAW